MFATQVEYLESDKTVTIVPNFNFGNIHLINGTYGPFRAGIPTEVPMWLANTLHKQDSCHFINPHWLEDEVLDEIRNDEKINEQCIRLPDECFLTIALSTPALRDDNVERNNSRRILTEINDLRLAKLRRFFNTQMTSFTDVILRFVNITLREAHILQAFEKKCVDILVHM